MAPEWLVMKLGGTSIARRNYWENITARIGAALDARRRVLVVHSAMADTTNRLDELFAADGKARRRIVDAVAARHHALARELQVAENAGLDARLVELRMLAAALPLSGNAEPCARAELLAMGERLFTELAVPFLQARGLPVLGLDARELLTARTQTNAHPARHYLAASCEATPDAAFARRLRARPSVILTQGFFARDERGRTVLLGRGGSDVSAACLAAKLGSAELEIWTDVPGLFSADPNRLPSARLLRELDYDEALEIAANGGSVLHPRCIPPLRGAAIPLTVRYTPDPKIMGTCVRSHSHAAAEGPKAVCMRRHIPVITVETPEMWQQAGFLADMFACFKRHDLSVDMIATSEASVTVSLDPEVNPDVERRLEALCGSLCELARVEVKTNCAAVSLMGRRIRANLGAIAPLLKVFEGHRVHLLSQASNDLNMTFLVDEREAPNIVRELHAALIGQVRDRRIFGPAWEELLLRKEFCTEQWDAVVGAAVPGANGGLKRSCVASRRGPPLPHRNPISAPEVLDVAVPWWQTRRGELIELARKRSPRYVYDPDTIVSRVEALRAVADRLFYAVKANDQADVLRLLYDQGLGFECVSANELEHLLNLFPDISRQRLLFTPNFAPRSEYAFALDRKVYLTLDNLYPLHTWPELFTGRDVIVRVDLGEGRGHHRHVRTAGRESKFGIPVEQLGEGQELARRNATRVIGLHAHAGSGILDTGHWRKVGCRLAELATNFPELRILNLGGGLGIPERPEDAPLDVARFAESLAAVRKHLFEAQIWLEPGRFLVGEAGVLLARVTQLKGKGETRYLGVDTGMNSLIRPALYGAWHPIANLSRLGDSSSERYTIVGPLCESGDLLGSDRALPKTGEGDVLLVANVGAYGRVMSSHYNRRLPAEEILLDCRDNANEHFSS